MPRSSETDIDDNPKSKLSQSITLRRGRRRRDRTPPVPDSPDLQLLLRDGKTMVINERFLMDASPLLRLEIFRHQKRNKARQRMVPLEFGDLAVRLVMKHLLDRDWYSPEIDRNDSLYGSPLPEALRFCSRFGICALQHHISDSLKVWSYKLSPGFVEAIFQVSSGQNYDPYLRRYLGQLCARSWSEVCTHKNLRAAIHADGHLLWEVISKMLISLAKKNMRLAQLDRIYKWNTRIRRMDQDNRLI